MFNNPFDAARAKIERSHRHFLELAREEAIYSRPQDLAIELVVHDNGDTTAFASIQSMPTLAHAAIVGDIVQALRSSLDLAVCEACKLRGATDVSKTHFAFAGSEKDWDGNVARRMANADAVVRGVVRSFRPWKANGNVLLYALSKLAASDKHVDLVGVGSGPGEMEINGLSAYRGDGKLNRYSGQLPMWRDANPVKLFTVDAPAKVEIAGPCILKARFGFDLQYGLPFHPALPILNNMGSICEKAIDALEGVTKNVP